MQHPVIGETMKLKRSLMAEITSVSAAVLVDFIFRSCTKLPTLIHDCNPGWSQGKTPLQRAISAMSGRATEQRGSWKEYRTLQVQAELPMLV